MCGNRLGGLLLVRQILMKLIDNVFTSLYQLLFKRLRIAMTKINQ